METQLWKLFAETGDPVEYLMCVTVDKAKKEDKKAVVRKPPQAHAQYSAAKLSPKV